MASFETRVVLLGKSTTTDSKKLHKEILNNISPTEIPKKFIDSIDVTFDEGQTIPFSTEGLKGNFSMEEIKEFLRTNDVKGKVELVEIVLNLDLVTANLQEQTSDFLGKYFD